MASCACSAADGATLSLREGPAAPAGRRHGRVVCSRDRPALHRVRRHVGRHAVRARSRSLLHSQERSRPARSGATVRRATRPLLQVHRREQGRRLADLDRQRGARRGFADWVWNFYQPTVEVVRNSDGTRATPVGLPDMLGSLAVIAIVVSLICSARVDSRGPSHDGPPRTAPRPRRRHLSNVAFNRAATDGATLWKHFADGIWRS